MSLNNRTLKINPDLFKLNGRSNKNKKGVKPNSVKIRNKPDLDEENSSKTSKIKKEMMKKVKDYQRNKEQEAIKEEKQNNNLFEKNTYENTDFEREFNKSLNFLQDLAKKNKLKKKNNQTIKNNVPSIEINLDLPSDINNNEASLSTNYGCLKNGVKPTYRQLNKTQKNDSNFKPKVKIVLENNIYDDDIAKIKENINPEFKSISNPESKPESKPELKSVLKPESKPESNPESNPEFIEILDNKIENLTVNENTNKSLEKLKQETNKMSDNNQIIELSDKPFMNEFDIDENIKPFQIKKERDIALENIPKITKITKKSSYKVGKINGKNKVGILIKNRETQKNIKHEISLLKQKSLQDIKNHLRSKNLIKTGSYAPNDVLRKMYEDSILSGEITNINNNNMVYNYLNE